MGRQLLSNATLVDGRIVDVMLVERSDTGAGWTIEAIADVGQAACSGAEVVDLAGQLLLNAPVEPHAHLDKAFLAESVPNPTGDLAGAIEAMTQSSPYRTEEQTKARAERAARRMAQNGYVAVRSHVDVTLEDGLRNVSALCDVRDRLSDVIDIELVALVGMGITGPQRGTLISMLNEALDRGVEIVGGCPHLEPDSRRATEVLVGVAAERDVAVDLHTDETLDPRARGLDQLVAAVEAGFSGPTTASHCVALGQRPASERQALAERLAEAGVSIVVLPQTNLYLQGRGQDPTPRGLAPVTELIAAGVNVCAGADNIQDPFNPVGRCNPFEIGALSVLTTHVQPHQAWTMLSDAAATALGRDQGRTGDLAAAGMAIGGPANLIAVRADSIRSALAEAPACRRWFTPLSKTR